MSSHFDHNAASWDTPDRVRLAGGVVACMRRHLPLAPHHHLADLGAGTGLVALAFAAEVATVTAWDASGPMREVLAAKCRERGLTNVEVLPLDLDADPLPAGRFDAIVSSMTLHHVRDVRAAAARILGALVPGGHLALADLDAEDGLFHADNAAAGVRHFGFDREALGRIFTEAGFVDVTFETAIEMERVRPDGSVRRFPVFVMAARRADTGP